MQPPWFGVLRLGRLVVRVGAGRLWLIALIALLHAPAHGQAPTLEYLARYDHQSGEPDHLMHAIEVPGGRAIVAGNRGLALIDLDGLPPGGTTSTLFRLAGVNARDVYPGPDGYYFVNLHRGESASSAGFAVVHLQANTLTLVRVVDEPDVLYEKMCVAGGYLHVAAHAHGLRIFDIADPARPSLAGSLTEGLVDAFAVAVTGDTAYVADGAGGLKVVDVSNPDAPILLGGDTLASAAGTSEDVTVGGGRVFVAAGGAGLASYPGGAPTRRELQPLDGCAESLAWLDDRLVVGTLAGAVIVDVSGPSPVVVAREIAARRGPNATLRICSGVSGASTNRLLCADWNYVDVYRLAEAGTGTQADVTPSVQRVRFAPAGGEAEVTLYNDGARALNITAIQVQPASFSTSYPGGSLAPGASATLTLAYDGNPAQGSGMVRFGSNDPDESPLPIQLFGNTDDLDPGEPAADFTLPLITRDSLTGEFHEEPFTLSDHRGQVVWFQVFATW